MKKFTLKDILPCPFCDVTPHYIEGFHHSGGSKWGAWISCESPRCYVQPQLCAVENSSKNKKEAKQTVIERWNKRAE